MFAIDRSKTIQKSNLSFNTSTFAGRFNLACDEHPHCPPVNKGRLGWISRSFEDESGYSVTIESARKWLSGGSPPRRDKIPVLANILNVSPVWLEMGPNHAPKDKRASAQRENGHSEEPQLKAGKPWEEAVTKVIIRAGLTVTIFGLPHDLSKSEATKIANIILAHAHPD